MTNKILLVAIGWVAGTAMALGEVPMLSKAALQKAPEIVVGKVVKIYQRDPAGSGFRRVDFVAELEVVQVEKGGRVKAGDVIYINYWNQLGKLPKGWTGSRGHDSQCLKEKAKVRIHISLNKQGQRNIVFPNGAEAVDK